MTHIRWAATLGGRFPEDKYRFSKYLRSVGDYITTNPINEKDYKRFKDAAYAWAYRRKWKVAITRLYGPGNMFEVTCTLIRKKYYREFF